MEPSEEWKVNLLWVASQTAQALVDYYCDPHNPEPDAAERCREWREKQAEVAEELAAFLAIADD